MHWAGPSLLKRTIRQNSCKARKLKLIILSDFHPKEKLGGGGEIAFEFHQILLRKGHQSFFWFSGNKNSQNEFERSFKTMQLPNRFFSFIRKLFGGMLSLRVTRAIVRENPELVWINQIGNEFSYITLLYMRICRIPTLITLHDYLIICRNKVGVVNPIEARIHGKENLIVGSRLHEKIRRFLQVKFVNLASGSVAVSQIQAKILVEFGVNITSVLSNGVPPCLHSGESTLFDSSQRKILFAGRFHRKGLEYLVQGIKKASSTWQLNLAGEPELFEYASSVLPLEQLEYHGILSRENLHLLMHQMDLVSVLSQYFDPYPTVALESIRHGSMFITTNTTGVSMLLDSTEEMFKFSVGEVPDLDALEGWLQASSGYQVRLKRKIPSQDEVIHRYLPLMSQIILEKNSRRSN
jgi:hypothetical protein